MPNFHYFQDVKCTVWCRVFFDVEADTEADADGIASRCVEDYAPDCKEFQVTALMEDETLYDTMDMIPVEENMGAPTIEVYKRERTSDGGYQLLADNEPEKK